MSEIRQLGRAADFLAEPLSVLVLVKCEPAIQVVALTPASAAN